MIKDEFAIGDMSCGPGGFFCALEVTQQQWMKPVIFHASLLVGLFLDFIFFLKMGVLDRHTTKIYFPIMNGKRTN